MNHLKNSSGFLLFIFALVLLWYLGACFHIDFNPIQRSLEKIPLAYSAIIYILLYVVVTFFIWFSKDVFRIMAALVFGAYISAVLVLIAEIINACILFHISRSLGRAFVETKLKVKYRRLDEKLAKLSFVWLFLFRAAPLLPFRFLDLAAGLTGISFRRYLSAVALGSPLRIFWIQFILAGVGQAVFNPEVMVSYFLKHNWLFTFSFLYLIVVIVVALKLRTKV